MECKLFISRTLDHLTRLLKRGGRGELRRAEGYSTLMACSWVICQNLFEKPRTRRHERDVLTLKSGDLLFMLPLE